jgi:hypothetical protein
MTGFARKKWNCDRHKRIPSTSRRGTSKVRPKLWQGIVPKRLKRKLGSSRIY